MGIIWAFVIVIVMFFGGITSKDVAAQTPVKHINIEGQLDPVPMAKQYTQLGGWTINHTTGTNETCATGTTNKYTISATPTLTAADTTSPDWIMFENVTITADSSNVCGHIYFWTRVLPDPSSTVGLSLSTAGTLKRGNGSAWPSWVHFSGWLQHPATTQGEVDGTSGPWEHLGTTSGPPGSPPSQDKHTNKFLPLGFSPPSSVVNETLSGINSPRIMKGEMWFRLVTPGDQLVLTPQSGVIISTGAGGGGGGGHGSLDVNDVFNKELADRATALEKVQEQFIKRFLNIEKFLKLHPPDPEPGPPGPEPFSNP